jgi:hypothetical protein
MPDPQCFTGQDCMGAFAIGFMWGMVIAMFIRWGFKEKKK